MAALTSAHRSPQEGNACGSSEVPLGRWGMRTLPRNAALATVAALSALLLTAAGASAATPIPRVVGPLPVSAASHPFGGAAWGTQPEALAAHGYVRGADPVRGRGNVSG